MNTGKLLQKILKDVCSEKFSTRIRYIYGDYDWQLVDYNEKWNGFVAITNKKSLYFVLQNQMYLDWYNIRNATIKSDAIVNVINNYNKRLKEVNINGCCIHELSLKRIEKMSVAGKNQNVAIFDYLNNEEIAIEMEHLQYFDLDDVKLIASENQYSPIVVKEDGDIRAIVMPLLR